MADMHIISLVSQKGGAGKSALAYAMGYELQQLQPSARVLLVDMDAQATVLKHATIARGELQRADVPECVAFGPDIYRRLEKLPGSFTHVLVDTPGRSGDEQRAALLASTLALVPVVFDGSNTLALEDTLLTIREAQARRPALRACLVLTQQLPRTELASSARETLKQTGLPVLRSEVYTRSAWRYAANASLPVGAWAPSSKAALEARALTHEVLRLMHPKRKEAPHASSKRQEAYP
jgi:chromosome partitioning protein